MRLHRGLIWIAGAPEVIERLYADAVTARLLLPRVAPTLAAAATQDANKLTARLEKLGLAPTVVVGGSA